MSAAEASSPSSENERVVWPDARARPELQTFYGTFRRHILLFMLYFLWIVGVGFFVSSWVYSAFTILRAIVTLNAIPVPVVVQIYLLVLAFYYSFHHVVLSQGRQQGWTALRKFARHSLLEYPYFRNHVCIFEGHEEDCLADPWKSIVKPKDKNLFAYHPHGVLSVGWALNGVHSPRFQEADARWLVAENLFWFPLLRDILNWLNFGDVEKRTFIKHMREDRNVCVIPGGFEEATLFKRGEHRVFIKKRFGFIKLALQHGYKVYPAYTFGEEETYRTFHYALKQRMLLNRYRVPAVLFLGRLACFFMPLQDVQLTTIVGKPIPLPHITNPSAEEVAKYHKIYVDALVDLFERNKKKYATDSNAKLAVF